VETTVEELHVELAKLEAAEARLSAERSRLQDQIDFGFGTETTRDREREVSNERRQVHERIDALRDRLRKTQLG
jgi:50S ribosomal subunit-associated GTPase HflX